MDDELNPAAAGDGEEELTFSNTSFRRRIVTPGSDVVPVSVCVFPLEVCPYLNVVGEGVEGGSTRWWVGGVSPDPKKNTSVARAR